MMSKYIYFDNNSTTKTDRRVLKAMIPYLTNDYGNSSSRHFFGKSAYNAVVLAREQVSSLIGCQANEIIFTSGATEAINMAIKGVAECYKEKGNHIVTLLTEHPAVLDTCKYLETIGFEVTYLSVGNDGLLDIDYYKQHIRNDTILVSVMHVNNETGVIQPIHEIAKIAHASGALFMTDGTQAVGKIPLDMDSMGIDLLCLSGHKFYAPKGIGALFLRQDSNNVKVSTLIHGGGQENGLRSGTLNVPGIVALGAACEIAQEEIKQNADKIVKLRNKLEQGLLILSNAFVNGNITHRIFNVSNICFPGNDATVLIGRLKNIAISNSSACSSATIAPSHVLKSMGLSDDEANASIRFSLGQYNTEREVNTVIRSLHELVH